MNNPEQEINRPHTAVVSIQLEVHSLLDSGECSGRVVNQEVLAAVGINDAFLVTINGYSRDDCLQKLKTKLEYLKDDHVEPK